MKNSIEQIMNNASCCCDTQSNKVAKENSRKFEIKSDEKDFLKIKVYNCLIKDNDQKKCDYLFIRDYTCEENKTEFYFVEFKGKKIQDAFDQIKNTIKEIKQKYVKPLKKEKIRGFIISSRVPSTGIDIDKLTQEFRNEIGKELIIKNGELNYNPEKSEKPKKK